MTGNVLSIFVMTKAGWEMEAYMHHDNFIHSFIHLLVIQNMPLSNVIYQRPMCVGYHDEHTRQVSCLGSQYPGVYYRHCPNTIYYVLR